MKTYLSWVYQQKRGNTKAHSLKRSYFYSYSVEVVKTDVTAVLCGEVYTW